MQKPDTGRYILIHLDEKSQILTTFLAPFGRYCWRRLPFGLSVSQDLFQAKMDQILEGLRGVISIADDVTVCGVDEEDHDRNLISLMERAAETGLVFNSDKCICISFFSNLYTKASDQTQPKSKTYKKCQHHKARMIDLWAWWTTCHPTFRSLQIKPTIWGDCWKVTHSRHGTLIIRSASKT